MLAGLVAITAPALSSTALSAVIIGTIAGLLVVASVFFVERTLKVDDPVGAISVHGICGAWGDCARPVRGRHLWRRVSMACPEPCAACSMGT